MIKHLFSISTILLLLTIKSIALDNSKQGWHMVHSTEEKTLYFVTQYFLTYECDKKLIDLRGERYVRYFQFIEERNSTKRIVYEEGWHKLIQSMDYYIIDINGNGINEVIVKYKGHHFYNGIEIYHYNPGEIFLPIQRRYSEWRDLTNFRIIEYNEKTAISIVTIDDISGISTMSGVLRFHDESIGYVEVLDTDMFEGLFSYISDDLDIRVDVSFLNLTVNSIVINGVSGDALIIVKDLSPKSQAFSISFRKSDPADPFLSRSYNLEGRAMFDESGKPVLAGLFRITEYKWSVQDSETKTILIKPIILSKDD